MGPGEGMSAKTLCERAFMWITHIEKKSEKKKFIEYYANDDKIELLSMRVLFIGFDEVCQQVVRSAQRSTKLVDDLAQNMPPSSIYLHNIIYD